MADNQDLILQTLMDLKQQAGKIEGKIDASITTVANLDNKLTMHMESEELSMDGFDKRLRVLESVKNKMTVIITVVAFAVTSAVTLFAGWFNKGH